jgi:transposase InsO family protein
VTLLRPDFLLAPNVVNAFKIDVIESDEGKPYALLHHSDQGSQYTSEQFQRLMADNNVTCSMSRSGNAWDNAAMKSFFSSFKTERGGQEGLPHEKAGKGSRVRLHRMLLQPDPAPLVPGIPQPYRL